MQSIDVHPSRYPESLTRRMKESLRRREMDHSFHYVSHRQAQRWLELHQKFSASRRDQECEAVYGRVFEQVALTMRGQACQVLGLGCGGGSKDARLIRLLSGHGFRVRYVAADVSPSLVLGSMIRVQESAGLCVEDTRGLVADFMEAAGLFLYWPENGSGEEVQIFSFLGMMPNFDPEQALTLISDWMQPGDVLVLSANLAPGSDYRAGCEKILPQYDNIETKSWLLTVMEELGVRVGVEDVEVILAERDQILRVEAWLRFPESHRLDYDGESFEFKRGEKFRLFYSNRFQPVQMNHLLEKAGLRATQHWLTPSEEEGVWCVEKKS
ncbi:MAG: L-histidine N(alpha)-methyltransferase [Blastochloris sp.]|nr:L-histidine N(alpha)-methyltransferase [Blastochloris sp.]